jgi:hypothetical protein
VGPTFQLGTEMWGAGAARGPAGPGEEGGCPGRSGSTRRAGLIPQGKKSKRFLIFELK